ncbi:MAG: hypothetical protein A2521_16460 [Deltaproteobacteria bacterium RIFOXYD12_FULL_57_12]|nr:MAG: hypothetical protein A2521_16460 [Deltaproteobacteria bacterium RIFOXYD12_FULL_57_12]
MKILITVRENMVAPRFDLATEVLIVTIENGRPAGEPRFILLPRASGEELCGMIVKEDVSIVLCGGLEETHYQYLMWKKIKVLDGIVGPYEEALECFLAGRLAARTILPGILAT